MGSGCGQCFETRYRNVPCAISLVGPSQALNPVDFDYDNVAADKVRRDFLSSKMARSAVDIWVTFVGRFETHEDSKLFPSVEATNGPIVHGFGHLHSAPGQLVVKTQRDALIRQKSSTK